MEVSEPDRHDLYQGMVEALGQRRAETFMNMAIPWSQVATKSDLERFATKDDLGMLRDALRAEMATKADLERMGRRLVMWTSSMMVAMTGIAFAAGRFI